MISLYDALLSEVTDDICKRVLSILLEAPGQNYSRSILAFRVYGGTAGENLAASTKDRKVRIAVQKLREAGFPVLSTSQESGYWFSTSDTEISKRAAKLIEQGNKTAAIGRALFGSLSKARSIREAYQTGQPVTQARLL